MRLSVVRLITGKEIRDLLRDRRTVMLIFLLPLALYPLFGLVGVVFANAAKGQKLTVGVVGIDNLTVPAPFPAFLTDDKTGIRPDATKEADGEKAVELDKDSPLAATPLTVAGVPGDPLALVDEAKGKEYLKELADAKRADVLLVVPPGFAEAMARGEKPVLKLYTREGEEKSKQAGERLTAAIRAWAAKLREKRFEAKGLPKDFDTTLKIEQPDDKKDKLEKGANALRDQLAKVFPLILVMWMVAGAVQPAVDLTAGEKERGTMETLLISPAERSEIVTGKFLAVTAFGYASVVWNVFCLAVAAFCLQTFVFGTPILNFAGLAVVVVFGLPIAMLFSAVAIALGVFARSTKEGQYYLIPLMLITMPLAFYSMMPGIELTPGTALVPVTGAMLFQQKVLAVTDKPIPWEMLPLVLGALVVYVAIALSLAAWQFRRESVLFRETGPAKSAGGLFAKLFGKKTHA